MVDDSHFSARAYAGLLAHYLSEQKRFVALLAALVAVSITLQLLNPQLVRRFLDSVENERSLEELLQTAALFMAIAISAQIIKLLATYVGENLAWRATNNLRADLALHCLRLDISFHKEHKPGELIERVDGDINQLANFFSQLFIQLTSNLLLVLGVLVLLWLVDWRIGAAITLIATAGLLGLNYLNSFAVPRWQALRQVSADLFGYLEEWLTGSEELQTNRAANYVLARLYRLLRTRWQRMQSAMFLNFFVISLPIIIPTLAYIAAYVWGSRLFQNGVVTIGTVYLVFYYVDVIKSPLWAIQRQVQDLQQAVAGLNRILALLDVKPTIHDGPLDTLPAGPLAVHFEQVSFGYEDGENTLQEIDFELPAGQSLGLLGRTGSGKTTITRLLFRFYDPLQGAIRLGDPAHPLIDLRQVSQAALRSRIGLVTQDVELFHASLRDNLTLFDNHIDDGQLHNALERLELLPWLERLPDGLNTRLEASGSLSAGEAQLVALARVFLEDPGLVILDEASSRLDPATEQLIDLAVEKLLAGRTAIIIAHRLATVQRTDRIMVLANGRILEYGPREALAADPGSRFRQMVQAGLAKEGAA